MEPHKLTDALR